jgi:hypothetical protein
MSCTLGPITFDLLDDKPHNSFTIKRDSPNATGVLTSTGFPSLTLVSGFSVSVTFPTDSPFLYTRMLVIHRKINFSLYVVFKCTVNVFNAFIK